VGVTGAAAVAAVTNGNRSLRVDESPHWEGMRDYRKTAVSTPNFLASVSLGRLPVKNSPKPCTGPGLCRPI
jgi:hypothetical protein